MVLKEIELDLPYEENIFIIEQIKKERGVTYQEAISIDYNENWKEKRRGFQLSTRCMTAMIERLCFPLQNTTYQKILVECVSRKTYSGYKNLLGVCAIQIVFDYIGFCKLTDKEKKIYVLNIVLEVVKQISELEKHVSCFEKTIELISNNNYRNEWYWKKAARNGEHILKIQIVHDVSEVQINLIVCKNEKVISSKNVIKVLPDERLYTLYLGDVGWDSSNSAYLLSKAGEKYILSF